MFPFLRGSRRGRRTDSARRSAASPFADSPATSRNRVVGRVVDDEDDPHNDRYQDDETDDDRGLDESRDRLPLLRGRRAAPPLNSYFEGADPDDYDDDRDDDDEEDDDDGEDDGANENEDEDELNTPLLPIFSAAHLDRLPVYNITHAIRLLVVQRCETTLSWDQLRSPQVSQFLVKPIQSQIHSNHLNRATLCALVANCLQFQKECQLNPANVGVSKTRALISELLAMRLIKEYSTRELIDALSYDFDPRQGMALPGPQAAPKTGGVRWDVRQNTQAHVAQSKSARVSTIEIAIRAQAKRFLAHPVVVQHLEAIWAGTIVFHSEADSLHRRPISSADGDTHPRDYGTNGDRHSRSALPADSVLSRKARDTRASKRPPAHANLARRTVTLYDPRDASLFKLSRLRVPRYRQVFSTLSFATLLGLFLAVLVERSLDITPLEVVFWFWSVGYMLDEVVGFTEQGFGLYILSFWNAFDLGILMLFVVYYCLRLYGVLLAEQGRHRIAGYAYDVLASTAILLFPRLFSVLDHYRYFSQLLIAFRMMAQDLLAILILILISCSGFFVAFTLSFADEETDANNVAYTLFQILMGFTPAAWDKWDGFNILGKAIMTIFLVVCHFLVVTILITVLTNSFMAIVQNANEEHQFLFAINTISMVKSDALFSYVAPANVIEWALSPLRYLLPFRQYLKVNRTIIKVTHFPLLFSICGYERVILSKYAFEPTDLVDRQPRSRSKPIALSINKESALFSPGRRLREPSVISFNKDRALDEVFRRPFNGSTVRTAAREIDPERRNSTNAVDKWMQAAENEGGASPPMEQPRSVLERLESSRPPLRRAVTTDRSGRPRPGRDFSTMRSMASEPDIMSTIASRRPLKIVEEGEDVVMSTETVPQETDADGDDENNADSDAAGPGVGESISILEKPNTPRDESDGDEYFQTPIASKSPLLQLSSAAQARLQNQPDPSPTNKTPPPHVAKMNQAKPRHARNTSTGTVMLAPPAAANVNLSRASSHRHAGPDQVTPEPLSLLPGQRAPKLKPLRPIRPVMPPKQKTAPSSPKKIGMTFVDLPAGRRREPSFNARALDLASEIGDNKWGPVGVAGAADDDGGGGEGGISGFPASFSEQLLREQQVKKAIEEERRKSAQEEKEMVNRIMLARMNRLEEGFREVVREIKDMGLSTRPGSESGRRGLSEVEGGSGSGGGGDLSAGGSAGEGGGGASTGRWGLSAAGRGQRPHAVPAGVSAVLVGDAKDASTPRLAPEPSARDRHHRRTATTIHNALSGARPKKSPKKTRAGAKVAMTGSENEEPSSASTWPPEHEAKSGAEGPDEPGAVAALALPEIDETRSHTGGDVGKDNGGGDDRPGTALHVSPPPNP